MTTRTMRIIQGNSVLTLPVNPAEVAISYPNEVKEQNLVYGAVTEVPKPGVMSCKLETFIPHNGSEFGRVWEYGAKAAAEKLLRCRNMQSPIIVEISGLFKKKMWIKSLTQTVKEGDPDTWIALELCEYARPADRIPSNRNGVPVRYHVVKKGEKLSAIAKKYKLKSWRVLYDANKAIIGSDPSKLKAGIRLVVPS